MSHSLTVLQADNSHLPELTMLFDAYRQFYGQASDIDAARQYLSDRLDRGESTIFLARQNETAAGFVQLYPSFSSVSMRRVWILNDLYVAEAVRRCGVATALLKQAADFARETNSLQLVLATAVDNMQAQRVYEKTGWVKNTEFLHYRYRC